jgi:2-hydroxy-3-keto-5-methylthiopentenyl-1-phosphate phosphatase
MMGKKKPVIAICYDFDGTLSPGNMQEYGFFSGLGKDAENFWNESSKLARDNNADPILAYMNHMIEKARIGNIGTTRQSFREYGKTIKLFEGVDAWFSRINEYGKAHGIKIEHYIVSSGLKEMIEGTIIGKQFEKVYACSFIYDNNDAAKWPAVSVNYTTKTQFLFRINKGIDDDNDNIIINDYIPEADRRVPFSRMIFIGDGATDIPCMKLVKEKGGYSIAVYDPCKKRKKKKDTEKLFGDSRVNFVAEANYTKDSHLDRLVAGIFAEIAAKITLSSLAKPLSKNIAHILDPPAAIEEDGAE